MADSTQIGARSYEWHTWADKEWLMSYEVVAADSIVVQTSNESLRLGTGGGMIPYIALAVYDGDLVYAIPSWRMERLYDTEDQSGHIAGDDNAISATTHKSC